MPRTRPAWTFPVVAFLGSAFVRLLSATWRVDEQPRRHVRALQSAPRGGAGAGTGPATRPGRIFCLWHSRLLLACGTQKDQPLHVLISRHHDGEYLARTVERLGGRPIRGSTTRGGGRALLEIVRVLEAGGDVILTPDGPKGPRLRVQQGCVAAASRTGAELIPMGLECRRARRLRSWDRFVVPWPFTKVAVRFGPPLRVPPDLDEASLAAECRRLEDAMAAASADAAAAAGVVPEVA